MVEVGFEPTPPERLELESSALDHSAIQPAMEPIRRSWNATRPGIGEGRKPEFTQTNKNRVEPRKQTGGTKEIEGYKKNWGTHQKEQYVLFNAAVLTAKNEDVRCHTEMEQCGLPR